MNGGEAAEDWLKALCVIMGLFQHGGRPLRSVTHQDYAGHFTADQIAEMFQLGLVYRPGFLVNTLELTGLVHMPPLDILEHRPVMLTSLDLLSKKTSSDTNGTLIGYSSFAGNQVPVFIPHGLRKRHSHLIGKSGGGKSSLLEHMIHV